MTVESDGYLTSPLVMFEDLVWLRVCGMVTQKLLPELNRIFEILSTAQSE